MIIPISEESFNKIAKYSNNIVEFIKQLNNDKDVVAAILSIPNAEDFIEGQDYSLLLKSMSIQDILTSLESIYGELKPNTCGFEGIYIYVSQILGAEYSYITYLKIATGEIECGIEKELSYFKNWGINATSDEFKTAILLSKIDNEKTKHMWKLIYQFLYCIISVY